MLIVQGYLASPLIVTQGYASNTAGAGPFSAEMTARPTYSVEARTEATYLAEGTAQGT